MEAGGCAVFSHRLFQSVFFSRPKHVCACADLAKTTQVLMEAGDCVLFSHHLFHGNFPNTAQPPTTRRMVAVSYRPR